MPGEHGACHVQSVSRDTLSPPGVGVPASPNVVAVAERPPGIVSRKKYYLANRGTIGRIVVSNVSF